MSVGRRCWKRSHSLTARTVVLCVVCAGIAYAGSTSPSNDNIDVRVALKGQHVVVDVDMPVAADPKHTWDVLTDYAHMAQFVSNLKLSEVVRRDGNELEVHQIGEAKVGVLHFAYDTVRAVELRPPIEVRSHLIRGNFKSYNFVTSIVSEHRGSLVVNHGDYVPDRWVPPIVGPALIARETRQQYAELRAEVMRRAIR